jgi:hypothetical protein
MATTPPYTNEAEVLGLIQNVITAELPEIRDRVAALGTGLSPELAPANKQLGAPTVKHLYIAGPGTYTTNGASIVLTDNFNFIISDGTSWSYLAAPIVGGITIEDVQAEVAKLANILPQSSTLAVVPASTPGYYSTFEGGALKPNNDYNSFKINWNDYNKSPLSVSGSMTNVAAALVSYYDINNTYMGFQFRGSNTQADTYVKEPLTIPGGTVFIGFTGLGSAPLVYTTKLATDILTEETGDARYVLKVGGGLRIEYPKQVKIKLATTDNIYLHGDSISSNDFTPYGNGMAQLTGVNVWRAGFPGFNSLQLTQGFVFDRLFAVDPKVIIALVGANDSGIPGSVGTFGANPSEPMVAEPNIAVDFVGTTFIQAISYQMRKMKAHYYNIYQRANLNGSETGPEQEAKMDAVNKPYIAFCTGLPQHRVDNNNAFSLRENWMRKRNAIVECCNLYNVHCIDTMTLIDWDITLEPFTSGKLGIYTLDGLHPNKYGGYQLAQVVCGGLGII